MSITHNSDTVCINSAQNSDVVQPWEEESLQVLILYFTENETHSTFWSWEQCAGVKGYWNVICCHTYYSLCLRQEDNHWAWVACSSGAERFHQCYLNHLNFSSVFSNSTNLQHHVLQIHVAWTVPMITGPIASLWPVLYFRHPQVHESPLGSAWRKFCHQRM